MEVNDYLIEKLAQLSRLQFNGAKRKKSKMTCKG
jgi:hypothetical protein